MSDMKWPEAINPDVIAKLDKNNLGHTSLMYLMALYYGVDTNIFQMTPTSLRQYTENLGIYHWHNDTGLRWLMPLFKTDFSNAPDNWEWVETKFRASFKALNKKKGGDTAGTLTKMKKFFANNPHIRLDDVRDAVEFYLKPFREGQDTTYMMEADNFIYKTVNEAGTRVTKSKLMTMLEQVMEERKRDSNSGQSRTMQGVL